MTLNLKVKQENNIISMEKFKTSWALHKNSLDSLAGLDQKVKQENSKISETKTNSFDSLTVLAQKWCKENNEISWVLSEFF